MTNMTIEQFITEMKLAFDAVISKNSLYERIEARVEVEGNLIEKLETLVYGAREEAFHDGREYGQADADCNGF